MAKRSKKGESISGFFRQVFQENPEWLGVKSNDAVLAKYREAHGMAADADVGQKVKQNLANLKSLLRKQEREAGQPVKVVKAKKPALGDMIASLEALEEAIEECRTQAKNLDREGLTMAINHLRQARNEVVWKLGQ